MEIQRHMPRRPPIRIKSRISVNLLEGAKLLGISKSLLYLRVQEGTVHVTGRPMHYRISRLELDEYAHYCSMEDMDHIQYVGDYAYIGHPLNRYAAIRDLPRAPYFHYFVSRAHGYDGGMYITPVNIKALEYTELEFVCGGLFRYNQMVMRHRPESLRRQVILCYDKKTRILAEELKTKADRKYPGVITLSPMSYVCRIKYQELVND